jgi:hypothetical protein
MSGQTKNITRKNGGINRLVRPKSKIRQQLFRFYPLTCKLVRIILGQKLDNIFNQIQSLYF